MVLLEAGRIEQTEILGDILDKRLRLADDLTTRIGRVDIDRRHIQAEVGANLLQIEAADTLRMVVGKKRRHLETKIHFLPVTPLAFIQEDRLILQLDTGRRFVRMAKDLKTDDDLDRPFQIGVVGSGELGLGHISPKNNRFFYAAALFDHPKRILGEVLVRAVGPEQVGNTHTA